VWLVPFSFSQEDESTEHRAVCTELKHIYHKQNIMEGGGGPNFFRGGVISVILGWAARVEISGIPNRVFCCIIFIVYTGRRGRRRTKLLDDLKERTGYSHLNEEALDRTMWRAGFGKGFGPVVRQTTKRMNT